MVQEELLERSKQAMNMSYSPYSHFKVGASILTQTGNIFTGSNIENVSYSLSMCAERVALFKALSEGHSVFTDLVISTSSSVPTFPCGACRQVLFEFCPDIKIHLTGIAERVFTLRDLLPYAFDAFQFKAGEIN